MPHKKAKVDWPSLDWTKINAQLARELDVSQEWVGQNREGLFPRWSFRKPRKLVLAANAKATVQKYFVPWSVANQWHREAGKTVKRGRPPYTLPKDFVPTTMKADAKRLGISWPTLSCEMKLRGIPTSSAPGPDGLNPKCFRLPTGYVPTTVQAAAVQFGVTPGTVRKALKRQGLWPEEQSRWQKPKAG